MGPLRVGLLLLACLPLACTPLDRRISPPAIYLLDAARGEWGVEVSDPGCRLLLIESVRAAPGYRSSRMIYQREPHRLDFFAHHRWADTPAQMLHPLFLDAAERAGLCAGVAGPAAPVAADYRLEVDLLALRQEISGVGSRVRMDLRTLLYGRDCLLGTGRFREEEPSASDPESGAAAASRATARIVLESMRWIGETMMRGRCAVRINPSRRDSSRPP